MAKPTVTLTLSEIAEIVGGELHGPADLVIERPVPAGYSDPRGITFAESQEYLATVEATEVGAVIIRDDCEGSTRPHIRHRNPREAFGRILAIAWRDLPLDEGVHPTAIVSPEATVGRGAFVGPYVVIERGAVIEEGAKVYAFCYIGENCHVGKGAKLYPRATLYRDASIGERTIVHSCAVVGADGFGFFWDGSKRRKVPQSGGVIIGDDCEIGALTAVDRATAGETRIREGTKLDNLVQVGHNVEIGEHSVIAGQCGIGGSTTVGPRTVMGGQAGVGDHVKIAADVKLGARAGVRQDIRQAGQYLGTPAREWRDELRIWLLQAKLPELMNRIKNLEREVERLSSSKHED